MRIRSSAGVVISTSVLLFLEFFEDAVQQLEAFRPRPFVALDPVVDGFQRGAVEPVDALAAFVAHVHRAHLPQDAQVLRHLRLGEAEHVDEVADGPLAGHQDVEDLPPPGFGDGVEGVGRCRCSCHGSIICPYGYASRARILGTLGSRAAVCHDQPMTAVADGPQRTDARGARRSASASTVLRAVLDDGPIARSTVARRTGLSAAAVTGHTAELLQRGLLRELPDAEPRRSVGRPHVPVDLDTGRHVAGALHLAVHHATVALLDVRGNILVQHEEPHDGLAAEDLLARAAEILDDLLLGHAPDREPLGLGVATGGWVDRASGTVVEHPLLGWTNVPVRDLLAESTGLAVEVDGHARALVHAERLFGHPRARESVVQL